MSDEQIPLLCGKILYLNLSRYFWIEIASGRKTTEYRAYNSYWRTRLYPSVEYDEIRVKLGYPAKSETDKVLKFLWKGYEVKEAAQVTKNVLNTLDYPDKVFCIPLIKEQV